MDTNIYITIRQGLIPFLPKITRVRSRRLENIAKEHGADIRNQELKQLIENQTKALRLDNLATDLENEEILHRPIKSIYSK